VAKQVFIGEPKVEAVEATEDFGVVARGVSEVEEDLAGGVERRKIQHRNGGGARLVEAGENLAVVLEARREGVVVAAGGELRRSAVDVVV